MRAACRPVFCRGRQGDIVNPLLLAAYRGAAVGAFGALLFIVGTRFGHGLVANYPRIAIRLDLLRDSMQLLRTRRMAGVLLISLAVWTFDGGAIWAVLRACGVQLGFYATCLAIGIVSLSTLLPSPPGLSVGCNSPSSSR